MKEEGEDSIDSPSRNKNSTDSSRSDYSSLIELSEDYNRMRIK